MANCQSCNSAFTATKIRDDGETFIGYCKPCNLGYISISNKVADYHIAEAFANKDYLFAGKLAALTLRTETAMRDIFDINYFAKNHWDINAEVIKNLVDKTVKEYLSDCIVFIEKTKDGQMLQGMGELMENEKQKDWVRQHLKTDVLFMLKNYSAVMK
jgi:hypothetical protein